MAAEIKGTHTHLHSHRMLWMLCYAGSTDPSSPPSASASSVVPLVTVDLTHAPIDPATLTVV
jgi:hypothetical protein